MPNFYMIEHKFHSQIHRLMHWLLPSLPFLSACLFIPDCLRQKNAFTKQCTGLSVQQLMYAVTLLVYLSMLDLYIFIYEYMYMCMYNNLNLV